MTEGITSIIPVLLIGFYMLVNLRNIKDLRKLKNFIEILENGGFRNCPFFDAQRIGGQRKWDPPIKKEGGETL